MKKNIFFILFVAIILTSCDKLEGPAGETGAAGQPGPAGPMLKGSVVGFVNLYEEFGKQLTDKSGVNVAIEGTNLKATTNSVGRYQIDSIPTGTYNISYSKTSYASYSRMGIPLVGGIQPYFLGTLSLTEKSTTIVTDLTIAQYPSNPSIMTLNFVISPTIPAGSYRYVRIFLGKTASVSSTNYLTTFVYSVSTNILTASRTIDKVNFPTGSTIYAIAYGDCYNSLSYVSQTTGLSVYVAINTQASNVSSMIVP